MKKAFLSLIATLCCSIHAWTQWSVSAPTVVCNAPLSQSTPTTISDGQGGMVMAWLDYRNDNISPTRGDIYIQRLDANGIPQWAANGIAVTTGNVNDEFGPQLALCYTSSGQPRIMVVWSVYEYTGETSSSPWVGKVLVQAYDLNGIPQYASPTLAIPDGASSIYTSIVPTADGRRLIIGCIRNYVSPRDIRVQGIEPNDGSTQFGTTGTFIANWSFVGAYKQIVLSLAEESNQVNVFWNNYENAGATNIYAQRINTQTGVKVWATNTTICNANGDQSVEEAAGNTVVWTDTRNRLSNSNDDIFAQRVNANGTVAWAANGIRVYEDPGTGTQRDARVAATPGGIFVTWSDSRAGVDAPSRLIIQKVLNNGSFPWGGLGITYQTSTGTFYPVIASQPDGGAVLVYYLSDPSQRFFRAQRITANGRRLWRDNGETVSGTAYSISSVEFLTIIPLSTGGGLLGFPDNSNNIYATRAYPCTSPPAPPAVTTVKRCDPPLPVSVTLNATGCAGGSVYWYQSATSGLPLQPGSAYTTSVNGDATFFAECVNNTSGCASYTLGPGFIDIVPANITNAQLPAIYNASNSPAVVETTQTITAANTIQATGNVIYRAGQSVVLQPNFVAEKNSTFLAEAKGCVNQN